MSTLAQELHAIPPTSRKATECKFARWLLTLDEEDRDAVSRLLSASREDYPLAYIYGYLAKAKATYSIATLQDHAGKRCVCYRNG